MARGYESRHPRPAPVKHASDGHGSAPGPCPARKRGARLSPAERAAARPPPANTRPGPSGWPPAGEDPELWAGSGRRWASQSCRGGTRPRGAGPGSGSPKEKELYHRLTNKVHQQNRTYCLYTVWKGPAPILTVGGVQSRRSEPSPRVVGGLLQKSLCTCHSPICAVAKIFMHIPLRHMPLRYLRR